MAFETGYAANEFELQQKVNAFILSIDGWSKVSQVGPFDAVYFSSGEDGLKDIYIRTRAGVTEEPAPFGHSQRDFGDGYVGYLNFFVYQYFPEDGDGYDGYGQAGQLGPCLYWFNGDNEYDLYFNRIASDNNWRWINYIPNRNPPGEASNWATYYSGALTQCDGTFDGKRYYYYISTYIYGGSAVLRFDLSGERADYLDQQIEGQKMFSGMCHWVDPQTRKEYFWFTKYDINGAYNLDDGRPCPTMVANQLARWDISSGVAQWGFAGAIWPDTSGDRTSQFGQMLSDGHNNLYSFRGSSKPHWAKYHIPSDTWVNMPDLPVNFYNLDGVSWLDRRSSGFDYNRIYWVTLTNKKAYYINISEHNGMAIGSWTSAGSLPTGTNTGPQIFHNRRSKFYYYHGRGGASQGRKLYAAPMTDGTLTWTQHKTDTYLPTAGNQQNSSFEYVDGYLSRVRTSLYDRTQYWLMGNKDRVIVLTKADDIYSYCYMGTFAPYASDTPHAVTTADIYAGVNVEVPINLIKGEFEVGQRMFIADVTDRGGGEYRGELEDVPRLFKPMEMFEILDVDPGVSITITSLTNNYPAGSRIAHDPQPVGVTLEGLDKIQMLNCINTTNTTGSIDMAENMARLQTVEDSIVNASGGDTRRGTYAMWPVNIVNGGTDAASSGTEIRGSLIGVFAISSTGDLSAGDTVSVGPNTYMVFDVESAASFLYAFGPIEE